MSDAETLPDRSLRRRLVLGGIAVLLLVALYVGWRYLLTTVYPVPERVNTPVDYTIEESVVVARISVPTKQLSNGLSRDVPRTLLEIDERVEECVPSEKVKVLGVKLFNTPTLGCNLVGEITRGNIAISGNGPVVIAKMPLAARIEVRDVGDVIKRETATAEALVTLRARLGVDEDWVLQPDLDIDYVWTKEPGLKFLGQHISLRKIADKKVSQMLPEVEAMLERKVREVNVRKEAEAAWQEAFATVSVNRKNPPVWINIEPRIVGADALEITQGEIGIDVMFGGELSLFVGDKPEAPVAIPLGKNLGAPEVQTFNIKVPVMADFEQLEPVVLRALRKLAKKGLEIDGVAGLDADFQDVTIYGAAEGKLAVGIKASVTPVAAKSRNRWSASSGTVWLTATPVTLPDSEVVEFADLSVYGDTDTLLGDALVVVLSDPQVTGLIQAELVQDFRKDYDRIIQKALKGLGDLKVGRLDFSFDVADIEHGSVQVTGEGLFMPVSAQGVMKTTITPPS